MTSYRDRLGAGARVRQGSIELRERIEAELAHRIDPRDVVVENVLDLVAAR